MIESRKVIDWPTGVSSALCMTFDMDAETMWVSRDPNSAHRPSVLSQGRYDVEEGLSAVLEFLHRNGISSTFFVPSDTAKRHPAAIREIVSQGHEIACHGTDHVPQEQPDRAEQKAMLERATHEIEDHIGVRPVGYRAPMYSVTADTWEILAELGYRYSSNMMDTIHPYLHDSGVAEIPVHWSLDDGPFFLTAYYPPNYRTPVLPRTVAELWGDELAGIAGLGGVTTLTLHPQLIGRPSRIEILQRLVDEAIERGSIWFPRMRDLALRLNPGDSQTPR